MSATSSFFQELRGLFASLPKKRRVQLLLLLVLMLVGAFSELLSLGALVPFLAIIADPQLALQKPFITQLIDLFGLSDIEEIRWYFTLIFACAALAAGAIRLVMLYAVAHFNFGIAHDLSSEVYRRALYQPYAFHVASNSSEVIGGISKVDAVAGVVYQLLTACSAALMAVFIVAALIIIDPLVASVSLFSFGAIYVVISLMTKKQLAKNSRVNSTAYKARVQALQEGLGGIRDVLLDHAQPVFSRRFDALDKAFRDSQASTYFIGPSPRFAIEAFGMVLIAFLAFSMTRTGAGISAAIPVLGALALGAQRLMPLAQQIYQGWVTVAGNRQVLTDVLEMLRRSVPVECQTSVAPLPFEHEICLREVSFQYQPQSQKVLHEFSLSIPKGARVGFVGVTGSGKSTSMDLLMGLLLPSAGQVLVDGQALTKDTQIAWQKNIAHVPQAIFLADASFAENIAFGVPVEEIDLQRVRQAAKKAQIDQFIESTNNGYHSLVGERGAQLSGGQRQRIGIARAFYRQAKVLVFDEATSALDRETEETVMGAIRELGRGLTVVLIAHRIETLKDCDFICRLEQGVVSFLGTYNELIKSIGIEKES